jgi:ferredoxin-NADP reductase
VALTLPLTGVARATPRAAIVHIGLDGHALPYRAGQALLVASHGYERRRPYSIAISPEESEREGRIELLVGLNDAGSPGPHLNLEPATLVDVEGPVGRFTFPDRPDEERFVFIAGGTGIAPLRAMLHRALHTPHKQIGVLYSARTPVEFAYERELRALAERHRIELKLTVTREAADDWSGARGRIGRDDLAPLVHDPATLCFICGPPALVDQMPRVLGELGVTPERIRIEEWG